MLRKEKELAEIKWVTMGIRRVDNKTEYFKGCLIGGAIGDALGYAVEFMSYAEIKTRYGLSGIRKYDLSSSAKALISDDTQMTLFTANGILVNETHNLLRKREDKPTATVHMAYLDWLSTQGFNAPNQHKPISWLLDVPELHSSRAPGNTCLSALVSSEERSVAKPINTSKGCGSVMRIAPYGLYYGYLQNRDETKESFLMGAAEIGAITHSHSMSHLSCMLMTIILSQIIHGCSPGAGEYWDSIENVVTDALFEIEQLQYESKHKSSFSALISKAIDLSKNSNADVVNIHALGGGWVAEEALAIAVYCACKYQDNPLEGIIAAANHDGDSDSTAAIAGNILGAWNGYSKLPQKYIDDLEIADVILEIAEDLATGCIESEDSTDYHGKWFNKYTRFLEYDESDYIQQFMGQIHENLMWSGVMYSNVMRSIKVLYDGTMFYISRDRMLIIQTPRLYGFIPGLDWGPLQDAIEKASDLLYCESHLIDEDFIVNGRNLKSKYHPISIMYTPDKDNKRGEL